MKQEVAICNSVVDLDGVKQKLAKTIARLIAHKKLKQREVEQLLNIKQPRVSDLVNGKVEKFSIDSLLEYLNKIGYVIEGYSADDVDYINTIKTRLVTYIGEIIVANKFKQRQVQKILNIKQPRVSDLVNKKIDNVSRIIPWGYWTRPATCKAVDYFLIASYATFNKSVRIWSKLNSFCEKIVASSF